MRAFLGRVILVIGFFPFITLNISCHSLLTIVSVKKSADNLMGFPLHVICCFSLVAFNIFSLYLIFVSLITVCLGVFLLASILPGAPCPSVTWVTVSFPMVGRFSTIISSYIFSDPFSFSFSSSSETSKIQMLICWKLVLWPCVSSKGSLLCLRVDCWPCLYDLAIMEQSVFIFQKSWAL